MNRHLFCAIFCAVAALCSLPAAHAEVLVYEGFHQGDWTGITATGSQRIDGIKITGEYTKGFNPQSKWSMADNTTQISVSGTDYGLALPAIMTEKGFTTCGGAAQCNPGSNSSELRGGRHDFASNTLKVSSGTLYVRALLRLTASAAAKLSAVETPAGNKNGSYFGFGLIGLTSSSKYAPTTTSNKSSCSFLMWKNSSEEYVLSLCLIDASGTLTHYPLVTGFNLGSTYICYAEIQVGAGTDSKEIVRAGAMDTFNFTGAASWAMLGGSSESVEVQLITDSAYPKSMAFAGPYGTNNGSFRADELVVGTEKKDILPVGGVFAVSASGTPSVGQDSFSTDYLLVADAGVTADAGFVWSTDETFATATTNSLGTGLAAGKRTASLTNLEPATTYWWKIYADNGSAVAESAVYSFTTTGAPVLDDAAAAVKGESAEFSVALAEAAMQNTLDTSVSIFYGTDGETWTELPLGSSATATNFSETVESLGYGVAYKWFARATATMAGGRVLSAESATKTFTTLYPGDMYVDAAAENATPPYSSPATAAPNIATALAVATDGATIHVAPGLYRISSPMTLSKAIRILGDDPDPSRVVVSNTVEANWQSGTQRIFTINHPEAVVANLTMQKGSAWGDYTAGGNFQINSAGGMVSNCLVEAGAQVSGHAGGGGGHLEAGIVTPTTFRRNTVVNSTQWGQNKAGVLHLKGSSRAENCLIVDNPQSAAAGLVKLEGTSLMRNCTIVNSTLSATNEWCTGWFSVEIGSSASVANTVVAGVTNKFGEVCAPKGTRANFRNGALDRSIEGTSFPADTVVGTAAEFFKDYANGDYTPKAGGPLVGKGANYEGMASFDLAGNPRKVGSKVDIGCYEGDGLGMIILVR
jgi:hypothetical protein